MAVLLLMRDLLSQNEFISIKGVILLIVLV